MLTFLKLLLSEVSSKNKRNEIQQIKVVVVQEESGSVLPRVSDFHEHLVEKSINDLDNLSDNGYHEIMGLDTGQNTRKDPTSNEKTENLQKSPSRLENFNSFDSPASSRQVADSEQQQFETENNSNNHEIDQKDADAIVFTTSPLYQHQNDNENSPEDEKKEMQLESSNSSPLLSEEDTE